MRGSVIVTLLRRGPTVARDSSRPDCTCYGSSVDDHFLPPCRATYSQFVCRRDEICAPFLQHVPCRAGICIHEPTPCQERTSRYIARLGKELVETLFEPRGETDVVDLTLLKSRQRDQLEDIFKCWGCEVPCDSACVTLGEQVVGSKCTQSRSKNVRMWSHGVNLSQRAAYIDAFNMCF